jgi:hypothetical protein
MISYTYTIDNCDLIQLMDDITLSLNKKLYAINEGDAVDGYAEAIGNQVTLNFYSNLTSEEEVILNNTISSYSYNSVYGSLKNFKLTNLNSDPSLIDYDILGLKKKRIITKGELRETGYYKNYIPSSQTYSDLVVFETRDYTRDALGIVQYRTQTTHWILNDNTTGLTKTFTKYYSPEEAIQEGIDRRTNMIAFAKTTLLSELKAIFGEPTNQSYAFDLLTSVKTQMDYFSQGYTQPLRDAISASTKAYMGVAQQDRITAATIVDSGASQTDTVTINGVDFSYVSSYVPTKEEIANGLINLITGSTNTSVSTYVSIIRTDIPNGVFDLKAKIPGWPFTSSVSANLTKGNIVANNNTLKTNVLAQLTF